MRGRHYRVVVTDDDMDMRLLARRALERSGRFTVVAEAADGREAVSAAAEHQPDLTLLDLVMPDTDGLAALPAIQEAAPECTVVVVTGLQQPSLADDALAAGAAGLLTKRPSWPQLVDDLLRLLRQPEAPRAVGDRGQEQLRLPAEPTSGGLAREFLRSKIQAWGLAHMLDEVELLTTELVNNAVLHATSEVHVRVRHEPTRLRVEVSDTGGGSLHRRQPELTDDSGRGLLLVGALARSWGTAANQHGKTVWFELDTAPEASET